ncbi:hypothetical protein M3Y99_01571600 [Aphelenchoides fujianensis]|nr:hypothetical protein M3Y99_01571600 [Aphelenchoides fujianensis]
MAEKINGLLMWYYFPTGTGRENQTAADMRDWVSFLGIPKPSVKQFAREITVCETTINDNVYVGRPPT